MAKVLSEQLQGLCTFQVREMSLAKLNASDQGTHQWVGFQVLPTPPLYRDKTQLFLPTFLRLYLQTQRDTLAGVWGGYIIFSLMLKIPLLIR